MAEIYMVVQRPSSIDFRIITLINLHKSAY